MNKKQERYLQLAKDIAKKKGGKCLSDEYVSNRSKLEWECHKKHRWFAPLRNINERDSWCPECRKEKRQNELLNKIKPILTLKGWKIIGGEIENWKKRTLKIICGEGHQWITSPQAIKHNGCPQCVKHCYDKEKHMQKIREIVQAKKGKIISGTYQNLKSVFIIQCKNGHRWKAKASGLKNDRWCPICQGRDKEFQLKKVQNNAKKRGGKCISNEYLGKDEKLKFECNNGHTFWMTPNNINKGQWCPECSWYFMEHKTRYTLEKLLKCEFNPNGKVIKPYILDGYAELECGKKIAFEYHGEQHYEFNDFFHVTKEAFEQRKKDDKMKEKLCLEQNIQLIIVPYYSAKSDQELLETIQSQLDKIGVKTQQVKNIEFFFKDFYRSCPRLNRLKKIITAKGGVMLTKQYNGKSTPITVNCGKGHIWTTKAYNLFSDRWCPYCANVAKDKDWYYKRLKEFVNSKGGVLLTKEYTHNQAKVKIECHCGKIFNMRVHNLISLNQWCPYCAKLSRDKKHHYDQLKKIAEDFGGTILSPEYTRSRDKLKIRCGRNHIFEKTANALKQGKWCPKCTGLSRDKKWQYEELKKEVMKNDGILITPVYTTASTKVELLCANGHYFKRTPYEIRRKKLWCPECDKKNICTNNDENTQTFYQEQTMTSDVVYI